MIKLDEAVIVEGKYDKIKLSSIIDALILVTNGFQIYKNKEMLELIRYYAMGKGIIIMTDPDGAGMQIRNYIKGSVKGGKIINVYIPDIFGKEKRKRVESAEGKLGVEGVSKEVIMESLKKAGVIPGKKIDGDKITKIDFYEMGLSGKPNSSDLRAKIKKYYKLPSLLSSSSLLDVLNTIVSKEELLKTIDIISNNGGE